MAISDRIMPVAGGAARAGWWQAVLVAVLALAFYAGVIALAVARGNDGVTLVRDPAASFDFWPLAGMLSYLGVWALVATGAVCLFAASIARGARGLLVAIGVFSAYVALDDLFMLHERVLPWYGLSETLVMGAMALAAAVIAVVFRAHFLDPQAGAIWLAVGFLVASVVYDLRAPYGDTQVIIEDGLKFTGLVLWAFHWTRVAHQRVGMPRAEHGHIDAL